MKLLTSVLSSALFALAASALAGTGPTGVPLESRSAPRVSVTVDEKGYHPQNIDAKAERGLILAFKRTSNKGCGQNVVFPKHGIRRELPLNQEVEIPITPKRGETITFTCGMGMYKGSIVAVSSK